MKLSKYIDHTLLKADASLEAIGKLCDEAIEYDFKSVCVNTCNIPFCKEKLAGSDVLVCCVIGFPLGAMSTEAKIAETADALAKGADEVDMVINIGRLKDKDYAYVTDEIRRIKETCGEKTLKVIIETCLLTDEEKVRLKYLYYISPFLKIRNAEKYERHFKYLKESKIPVPPIEIQDSIIADCSKVDTEFEKTRMTDEDYKKKIEQIFVDAGVIIK